MPQILIEKENIFAASVIDKFQTPLPIRSIDFNYNADFYKQFKYFEL